MNPSPFEWRTGQPSIFGGLQKEASISKRAAETQGTRFRQDPVKLIKKPNRNGSGRTIQIGKRIDMDAAYAYRISGKTWDECGKKFGCSTKHMHKKLTELHPELLGTFFVTRPAAANKPKDIDITAAIRDILNGMSIRQAAPKYGISHVSLGRRLRQTDKGVRAIEAAKNRALDMNAQKKAEAQKKRLGKA